MNHSSARLLLIDENVRGSGGHYLELASLLMDGARELGVTPTLAASESFSDDAAAQSAHEIVPCLQTRRMNFWSLGVDGNSLSQRNTDGRPIGNQSVANNWHRVRDPLSRRARNPKRMIQQWSCDFLRALEAWQPRPHDHILINTADDFVMLALANALKQYDCETPLNINAIFHFAVFQSHTITRRAREFGRQVNAAVAASSPHRLSLFATTHSLAEQLAAVGVQANPVPYPTRDRKVVAPRQTGPLKILMAGMPRAEKGRDQIPQLLSSIHDPFLAKNQFQVSMQVRHKDWKRLIPGPLHQAYRAAVAQASNSGFEQRNNSPLEIVSSDLPGDQYHRWLGTADIGLFLYDPVRYVARCSGVLLEMMVAGVPVIVPEHCWLDDQLEQAGGDGSIGYRYRSIQQIPSLLRRIRGDYNALRKRSIQYAAVMANRHRGARTLRQIGIPSYETQQRLAS